MGTQAAGDGGLACIPSAIPASERAGHFALARELFHKHAEARSELANGYAFRFGSDALEALTRFVANERKCCPFMSFEITVGPASGPIWLKMTGPAGTRAVLQAELDLSNSCGCCAEEKTI
jgi:hypothetical protein